MSPAIIRSSSFSTAVDSGTAASPGGHASSENGNNASSLKKFRKRAFSSSEFVLAHAQTPPPNTQHHQERLPSIDTLTSPQLGDSSSPQFNYYSFTNSSGQFSKVTYDERTRQGSISSLDSAATSSGGGGGLSPGPAPGPTNNNASVTLPPPNTTITSTTSAGSGTTPPTFSNGNSNGIKRSYSSSEVDEPGWDDRCIDNYYQVIHPTLPILPSSKVRLRARLLACSNTNLRYTVLCAVNGLVKKKNDNESQNDYQYYKTQVLRGMTQEDTTHMSNQSRILYLMSLILLFLQTSDSIWLGGAINLAYEMGLHNQQQQQQLLTNNNSADDDSAVARRLFLILVNLDRLNATLKQVPVQIPESVIRLSPEKDMACFGGSKIGIHVVRLCIILGHAATQDVTKELSDAYQAIETLWDTMPILKALYYLVLVHVDRLGALSSTPDESIRSIISNSASLSVLLESPLISVSPLVGYFVPPLVTSLLDVASVIKDDNLRTKFWSQLDNLDGLLERKFPDFKALRHDISQARIVERVDSSVSPKSKLEGLAAIAHAAHQQQTAGGN